MSESSEDDHAIREFQDEEMEINPDDQNLSSFRNMSRIMQMIQRDANRDLGPPIFGRNRGGRGGRHHPAEMRFLDDSLDRPLSRAGLRKRESDSSVMS